MNRSFFDRLQRRRAPGFSLIELSLALALASGMVVSSFMWMRYQTDVEEGRAIGQTYARLNNAVGNYMTTHYESLVKLPEACGQPVLRYNRDVSKEKVLQSPAPGADCSLSIPTPTGPSIVLVRNGLMPTQADLRALNLLDASSVGLPLPFINNAVEGVSAGEQKSKFLQPELAVLITKECVPGGGGKSSNATAGCPQGGFDLRSLVFNTQPYDTRIASVRNRLGAALRTAGSEALMSGSTEELVNDPLGMLRGLRGTTEKINPIANQAGVGAPGIFAMRNGYGSSGQMKFARTDGSVLPTADWDFNQKSLKNVKDLAAENLSVSGAVSVTGNIRGKDIESTGQFTGKDGNFSGTLKAQDLEANNQLKAKDGIFSGLLSGLSAKFSDLLETVKLKVTGQLDATGPVALTGDKTEIKNLRLSQFQSEDDTCDPTKHTLAQQNSADYANGGGLLLCNPSTKKWQVQKGPKGDKGDLGPAGPKGDRGFPTLPDKKIGEACSADAESLAFNFERQSDWKKGGPEILVCEKDSKKWASLMAAPMAFDYYAGWFWANPERAIVTNHDCTHFYPPVVSALRHEDGDENDQGNIWIRCENNLWVIRVFSQDTSVEIRYTVFQRRREPGAVFPLVANK